MAEPAFNSDALASIVRASRVALLLTGEAFRSAAPCVRPPCERLPCNASSTAEQHDAAASYVRNVIRPLVQRNATVDVVLTFPHCSDGGHLLTKYLRWFAPHVVAHHTIASAHMGDGIRQAHELLLAHYRRVGSGLPDYVLQGRHDIYIEAPLPLWPANFSKLSFERLCADCDGGCGCNGRDYRVQMQRTRADCRACHGDKLLWMPRHSIRTVTAAIGEEGDYGHDLIYRVLGTATGSDKQTRAQRWAPAAASDAFGYLFPEECGEFPIQLICNEFGAYRPQHLEDTGSLPPSAAEWAREHRDFPFLAPPLDGLRNGVAKVEV